MANAFLGVDKEEFVKALRAIPSGPTRITESRLRKLAYKYRHLKECTDEIPLSLKRFGLRDRMTYDDFIWEQVG